MLKRWNLMFACAGFLLAGTYIVCLRADGYQILAWLAWISTEQF